MEYLSHAPLRWSAWFPWSIDPQDKPWEGKELYFVYLGGRHLPVDTRQQKFNQEDYTQDQKSNYS